VIHLDLKPANIFVTGAGRFKIGDFGMGALWPRARGGPGGRGGFEREGDKVYLAAEVLRGGHGPAADVFSLGMIMLEAATNVVLPDQGEPWQRLRREDLSQVELDVSPELASLIRATLRADPAARASARDVCAHPVVARARRAMDAQAQAAAAAGRSPFEASPLAGVQDGFLEEILGRALDDDDGADFDAYAMDVDVDFSP
jgi:mitosis inhibitor protein kinase SWE1